MRGERPTLQDLQPLSMAELVTRELPRDAWKRIGGGEAVKLRDEHLLRTNGFGLSDYCGRPSDRMSLGTAREFEASDSPCAGCAAAYEAELDAQDVHRLFDLGGEG